MLHPGLASANNCSSVYDRIPGKFFSDVLVLYQHYSKLSSSFATGRLMLWHYPQSTVTWLWTVGLILSYWRWIFALLSGLASMTRVWLWMDSTITPSASESKTPAWTHLSFGFSCQSMTVRRTPVGHPCRSTFASSHPLSFNMETLLILFKCIFIHIYNIWEVNFTCVDQWLHTA